MRNKLLYAYKCRDEDCQIVFEEMRLMDERNNPISCPKCGKTAERTYDSPPPRHVSWSSWNNLSNQMIYTPRALEIFQKCPALLHLQGQPKPSVHTEYVKALRRTIFQMYSRLYESGKPIKHTTTKNLWDKNWWALQSKKVTDQGKVFESASDGWILLEKFWGEIYLKENDMPLGVNFEFTLDIEGLQYKIHEDLTLASKDGIITIMEFGKNKKEWDYYNSLGTKLEVCALGSLDITPARKIYLDITTKKKTFTTKTLNISPKYAEQCKNVITAVSKTIASGAVYTSPSKDCVTCPVKENCWVQEEQ